MPNSLSFDCCCDVAVVGGGIAGVAAALQAARSGMKTILIEKTILTGGLATTGLVYFYLPLCDGNGRQVTFGITEELLRASLQYGPGDIPADWHEPGAGRRLQAVFSPAAFVLAMDEMLEKFPSKKIIMNMENLKFMDSTGIGLLLGRYKKIISKNSIAYIMNPSTGIDRLLTLSGIYQLMPKVEK